MGCSAAQSFAPDYEITSENDKNISNLKVKVLNFSTASTEEQELRQIAKEIKGDNAGYDALGIEVQKGTQENGTTKATGTGTVVNNQEAAGRSCPTYSSRTRTGWRF